MDPKPSKKEAFAAWDAGKCSDAQLDVCIQAMSDLDETFTALGIHGLMRCGFFIQLDSLNRAKEARERNR